MQHVGSKGAVVGGWRSRQRVVQSGRAGVMADRGSQSWPSQFARSRRGRTGSGELGVHVKRRDERGLEEPGAASRQMVGAAAAVVQSAAQQPQPQDAPGRLEEMMFGAMAQLYREVKLEAVTTCWTGKACSGNARRNPSADTDQSSTSSLLLHRPRRCLGRRLHLHLHSIRGRAGTINFPSSQAQPVRLHR